jgi:hypothetical protein
MSRWIRRALVGTAAALLVTGLATAPVADAATFTVLKSGLDNPRGLSYAGGKVFVALAGKGGSDCPSGVTGPEGGPVCVGRTGRVISVPAGGGSTVTLANHLISFSDVPGGLAAEGPESVNATPHGLQVQFGESVLGFTADIPSAHPLTASDDRAVRAYLGSLRLLSWHSDRRLADVGDADYSWTAVHKYLVPDQYPDANPNDVITVGSTTYVADAGANTLTAVDGGYARPIAFFPNPASSDAVPTCVAKGPDNALYVGQLSPGAPTNGSKIYRYDLTHHTLKVWKSGLNVVDGCGFDNKGNFFAVEFQAHGFNPSPSGNPAGDIVEFTHSGARHVLGAGKLFYPQGFATDNKGHLFVSNWSIFTGTPDHGGPTGALVRLSY